MAKAVYLVHYKQPRKHVRHAVRTVEANAETIRKLYRNLHKQVIDTRAEAEGIAFVLVRTWKGRDAVFERKLKDQKHHSRLCPFCNPNGFAKRTSRMR
ncbi:MAG: hypothetical protein QM754_07965 [Tepidisphaeraceae bacterium]